MAKPNTSKPPATPGATPPAAASASPAPATAFPSVAIIERRIRTGDANVGRAIAVQLRRQPEPMDVRVINTALPGRFYAVTQELGWVPVEPSEIEGGLTGDMKVVDGHVVMGEHGHEMLMKMPVSARRAIQKAKETRLDRQMRSKANFQQRVQRSLEQDASHLDRGGADALERQSEALGGLHVEQFETSVERVPIDRT